MRTAAICPICATYENCKCVLYDGAYLANTDINPLDSVEECIIKINDAIGASGTSGTSGSSGTSGLTGSSGTSGINGVVGTSGTSGSSSTSGSSGTSVNSPAIEYTYTGLDPVLTLKTVYPQKITVGNILIETGDAWAYVDSFFGYSTNLTSGTTGLEFVNLTGLYIPSSGAYYLNSSSLTSLSFPELLAIQGFNSFEITCPNLTNLNLPKVKYILVLSLTTNKLTSIDLSSLEYGSTLQITSSTTLQSIDLSSIKRFNTLIIAVLPNLTTVNLGTFATYLGAMDVANNPLLTTFSLPPTIVQINGNINLSGNGLLQSSIDNILVKLASLDGTGGTTAYSSKTINLTGGTNSTPSATGLAAKSVLQGRACTVTNN